MIRRGALAVVVAVVVTVGGLSAGSASAAVPSINWPALLPALPSPNQPQPGAVPHCLRPTLGCVGEEIRRMKAMRAKLGCDHRAVFTTTYLELTRQFYKIIRQQPHFYSYPRYLFTEDALFADVYFNTLRRWRNGKPVDPAWRIALETARSGSVNGAQDMLLGINAHVQNDMPFVIAALGLRTRDGKSRKPDHDKVNDVLNQAYERVVSAIAKRYDPLVGVTNSNLTPLDDVAGLELVKVWREQVWRNAERLVNAKSAAERAQVAESIHSYAAGWAQGIAAIPTPGYRAQRDAYCQQHI